MNSKFVRCCDIYARGVGLELNKMPEALVSGTHSECLHHGGICRGRVYENNAKASGDVHHGESHHDVGAGSVAQPDDALDTEGVQNVDQVLPDGLDGGPLDIWVQVRRLFLLAQQVHVDEHRMVLDGSHGRMVRKPA